MTSSSITTRNMQDNISIVVAKYDYNSNSKNELTIKKDEKLILLNNQQEWWEVKNSLGHVGYVPSNYIKFKNHGIFSTLKKVFDRDRRANASIGSNNRLISQRLKHRSGSSGDMLSTCSNQDLAKTDANSSTLPTIPNKSSVEPSADFSKKDDFVDSNNYCSPAIISTSFNPNSHSLANRNVSSGILNGATNNTNNRELSESASNNEMHICIVKFHYAAQQPDELTIYPGDIIMIKQKCSDSWWNGQIVENSSTHSDVGKVPPRDRIIGWFPSNYTELVWKNSQQMANHPSTPPISLVSRAPRINSSITDFYSNGSKENHVITNNVPLSFSYGNGLADSLLNKVNSSPINTTTTTIASSSSNLFSKHMSNKNNSVVGNDNSTIFTNSNIPNNIIYGNSQQDINTNVSQSQRICIVHTLFGFNRNHESELSFEAYESLEITDKPRHDPDWWMARNSRNEMGLVPINHIASLDIHGLAVPVSMASDSNIMPFEFSSGDDFRRAHCIFKGGFIDESWYWGAISRDVSESMLKEMASLGQFIVRDSESHPGNLTITMFAGSRCRNFKVSLLDKKYCIGQKVFDKMLNLLDFYTRNPIFRNETETLLLTIPFSHPGYDRKSER